jgi:two-component system sensor histidine kinase RegB
MADPTVPLFDESARGHWVRLRTLIVLRWVAVAGQLTAIETARHYYGIQLPVGLCYVAIGTAIVANLVAVLVYPENKRLSENETLLTLLFDISQLSFLLYLTGGLNNPFALMVLTPVTIAATALRLQSALIIGGAAAVLATQLALAREQKLTDLGGVVAAAAHELGTPLATIKLTSSELMEELDDRPELREDAALIRDQADRCRDILRSMGRAGKEDLHMRQAPLTEVLREASEPHMARGKVIHQEERRGEGAEPQPPAILRRPEIIHGLRNLIQNAVDFARANVWIEAAWSADEISVRIVDDGPGFPPQVIGRIGDPFMRSRRSEQDRRSRPEYEGMGLGLFIAKTLLERSGAELSFANGSDPFAPRKGNDPRRGAIVEVVWPRRKIDAVHGETPVPLGQNRPLEA